MKIIILLLSLSYTLIGSCCTCVNQGEINDEQYNSYDLIVKGQIEKIEEDGWSKTIHIRIETLYKGQHDNKLLKIQTPSQSGMCGIFPKVGENWLMFTYKNEKGFTTSLCTRTKNMNRNGWDYNRKELKSDVKFLERRLNRK